MAHSRKKVIVRTTTSGNPKAAEPDIVLPGYLPATGILSGPSPGQLDLLDLDGRILSVPFPIVRSIAFVRDFNLSDKLDPERLTRRTFLARPRSEGLWLRLTLTPRSPGAPAPDILEGLAPLDISLLDALIEDRGLFLIPPDIRSNAQRLFIPRHAIAAIQLLAVITTPSKSKPTPQPPQPTLFQ